ncbi:MAG: hypothetical protein ACREXS_17345 [Gammaproteobacteria bacterium]
MLFFATAPSLGYSTGYLTPDSGSSPAKVRISTPDNGATYYLESDQLTVKVEASANWGITSIVDAQGTSLLADGKVGNELIFYQDGGDIYEFGNEYHGSPDQTKFHPATVTVSAPSGGTVLESGPLRVRLQVTISVAPPNREALAYVRE